MLGQGRPRGEFLVQGIKRHVYAYLLVCIVTALVGLVLGVMAWYVSPYAGFPWILTALLALLPSLVGTIRLRALHEPYKFGVTAIQTIWWAASSGFAGVLFFPADYFTKVAGAESTAMAVVSAIWLIWGLYLIYAVHRETKAPLAP